MLPQARPGEWARGDRKWHQGKARGGSRRFRAGRTRLTAKVWDELIKTPARSFTGNTFNFPDEGKRGEGPVKNSQFY